MGSLKPNRSEEYAYWKRAQLPEMPPNWWRRERGRKAGGLPVACEYYDRYLNGESIAAIALSVGRSPQGVGAGIRLVADRIRLDMVS